MKTSILEKMIKTEFNESVERNDLSDWFTKKQMVGAISLMNSISLSELIVLAESCGIRVTREKNKKVFLIGTSIGYMQKRVGMTHKKGVSIPIKALDHITKMYKEHIPVTKIARLYNVSNTTVREFIHKHSITKEELDKAVIRKRKKVFN